MSKSPTIKEIKKQLDDLGVEYDNNLKKDDLLELLDKVQKRPPEQPKKYVVIRDFKDLEDNSYVYLKDDPYPRKGNNNVTEERIQELMSNQNKQGKQLIKEQA